MVISKKTLFYLSLVFFFSILSAKPLFNKGFFPMHDDTQPTRVYEMAEALRDGQFPVRWVKDLGYGYGYPIFNFYAPLPYYVGALGVIAGLDVLVATKLMFLFGILLASISMFFLGRSLWGEEEGFISSLLYTYAPYHAVQIYVRGAVGEYWAYGFLPLIVWGIHLAQKTTHYKKAILIGSLGLAGIILSHNITAMIGGGIILIWGLVECLRALITKKWNRVRSIGYITILGLGISAFFWLPALVEARYTRIETLVSGSNNFHNHFVFLDQLWDSPWGYAGSAPNRADGMSFKLGKLHILIGLITLGGFILSFVQKRQKIHRLSFFIFFSGFIISIFLMLQASAGVWEKIDFFKYIQYPWRLLTFASFFLALIGSYMIYLIRFFNKFFLWTSLIVFIVSLLFLNLKYFQPQFTNSHSSQDYISQEARRWNISRISDEYLPKHLPIPQDISQIKNEKIEVSDDIIVEESQIKSHLIKTKIFAKNAAEVIYSLAFFPGWRVIVDSQEIKPLVKNGIIVVPVNSGRHIVTVFFSNTPVRTVSNLISFVSIIGLAIFMMRRVTIS